MQDLCAYRKSEKLQNKYSTPSWNDQIFSISTRKPHFIVLCCTVPEKAMAPHSSTLAWKIPWTEGPGGLQSMGLLGVGHDWSDLAAAAAVLPCFGQLLCCCFNLWVLSSLRLTENGFVICLSFHFCTTGKIRRLVLSLITLFTTEVFPVWE